MEKELLETIMQFVNTLPEVEGIFGYGSGIKLQSGYERFRKPPQKDLIVVVKDTATFHRQNLVFNP